MTKTLTAHRAPPLTGDARVPGDKSISHRALMFGGMAMGKTLIKGLLEGEDVLNTARAITALGGAAHKIDGVWEVTGAGIGGFRQPETPLDFGNSGTGVRLMLGILTGHDVNAQLIGDASLSRRPMGRVLTPLRMMGLEVIDQRESLPLTVRGSQFPVPITYPLPVPSAQVKSAVLLAGLHATGETTVIETQATRDHTERMLRYFGAQVVTSTTEGQTRICITGDAELTGRTVTIPGDPSSAAFLAAAAAIVPDSDLTISDVLTNPTRIGFYQTLREMGADIAFTNERVINGEPVADIRVRYARLKGVTVPAERAPTMIDEYPVLACVAAFAENETIMHGLAELKVKESDRLASTAAGLAANGVLARIDGDTLTVSGEGKIAGGGTVTTHLDHRIAMAFLILGLASDRPVTVDDGDIIDTSFPEFSDTLRNLGAVILTDDEQAA
ncbi:MAG: 3-phosphoshikimate 1-carboxyvinyltransferase [Hyphomicrobiaceae bacterium]